MQILIASKNKGKIKEFKELLGDSPLEALSAADFPEIPEPEETGETFAANAVLKASYYALRSNLPTIADDSGLEAEALGGAPGVFSARYGGAEASSGDRIKKLLAALDGADNRRARFVCAIAVANSKGEIQTIAEGVCEGSLLREPRGTNGFGYDPVFIPDGYDLSFGELADEIKSRISHRALATAKIIEFLRAFPLS